MDLKGKNHPLQVHDITFPEICGAKTKLMIKQNRFF